MILGNDFQGWPIKAQTLREILDELGIEIKSISNPELLDCYPLLLQDDGMGYGVDPMFITEVDKEVYENERYNVKVFNLFRDGYRQTD